MDYYQQDRAYESGKSLSEQFVRVFGWMFIGLIITGVTAVFTANALLTGAIGFSRLMFYSLIAVELGLVWFLASRAMKMSYGAAATAFAIYSVVNGVTLSTIFLAYTASSIAYVFFISAAFFGFMSVYGIVTKQDLTSLGSLFFMGLIGLIITSVINIFLRSSTLDWIISFVGVAIFLGLTAYDSQKIKDIHYAYAGTDKERNVAIVGALTLYLDFVNLFLYILRILGKRR
ncbi:MAG: Bax inhibitor-1/YccA family protein [Clostridia bacterium]|nr:Bax inhibitor-1/YccA family protein [Clostridia bacterium]